MIAASPQGRLFPGPDLTPPKFLDERAKVLWTKLAPLLPEQSDDVTAQQLGRYCVMHGMWEDAVGFVRQHGPTYTIRAPGARNDGRGRVVGFRAFPQVADVRSLHRELVTIERRLFL